MLLKQTTVLMLRRIIKYLQTELLFKKIWRRYGDTKVPTIRNQSGFRKEIKEIRTKDVGKGTPQLNEMIDLARNTDFPQNNLENQSFPAGFFVIEWRI